MKKATVLVLVIVISIVMLICVVCVVGPLVLAPSGDNLAYDPLERAKGLVAVGDSREKAIELLAADAWYHQPCRVREDFATDLFFYGNHSYDRARIVIVDSRMQDRELKVTQVSSFEPYMWQSVYASCIDEERFEYGLYERFNDTFWFLAP